MGENPLGFRSRGRRGVFDGARFDFARRFRDGGFRSLSENHPHAGTEAERVLAHGS